MSERNEELSRVAEDAAEVYEYFNCDLRTDDATDRQIMKLCQAIKTLAAHVKDGAA